MKFYGFDDHKIFHYSYPLKPLNTTPINKHIYIDIQNSNQIKKYQVSRRTFYNNGDGYGFVIEKSKNTKKL